MNAEPVELPQKLRAVLGPALAWERPPQGSVFDVNVVTTPRGRFIVKRARTPETMAELTNESRVLAALAPRRPRVAAPVAQVTETGAGWFAFTYLPGTNLAQRLWEPGTTSARRHALVAAFGRTLRTIHDTWTPDLPRKPDWTGRAVALARQNARARNVDAMAAGGNFWERDAPELANALENAPGDLSTDVVFGHGDWCLPNVLADESGQITGVIDWCSGGYGDRRFDLATGLRTLRYNLDALSEDRADAANACAYLATFLNAYGYCDPPETLRLFEALYSFL